MKTLNKPTTLLVARVSDVEQRKALPAQQKRLYEYAAKNNWKQDIDFKYIEFDETAFKQNRKTFNELVITPLENATEPSIVVFDKIDRFSRDSSSTEKATLTRLYESGKLEMHFPSDNLYINKNSPAADRFRLDIGISLAAYYSSSIRDNVKRRFDQLRSEGVWTHQAPIGYRNIVMPTEALSRPLKGVIVDEERAHYVVKVFELRAQGMPYAVIAKEITKAGYVSRKTGKAKLTKATVEKMLQNKFYYGIMEHDGVEYKHNYPALIDRALYNRCQRVKETRGVTSTKWNSLDFNFNDIVRCGRCGRTISSFKSKRWVYLKCANPLCDNPNTAESLVLGSIGELFHRMTVPKNLVEKVLNELKRNHDDQQMFHVQSINSIRKEYDEITVKLENWFEKLVDEKITPEQHERIVKKLTGRQEELDDRLNVLTKGNKDFLVTASYLLDLLGRAKELFELADEHQRSKLIGFMVSNLQLNDKKLSYTVNYPFDKVLKQKEKDPDGSKTQIWCRTLKTFYTLKMTNGSIY
ncbi:recombinase family protein [Candidatus Saccharibacteria bacterium]|nr:recombinase family protein [Candidatus Saccharibacteria bacterium]